MHTCIHAYMHTYIYTCVHMYMRTCVRAYVPQTLFSATFWHGAAPTPTYSANPGTCSANPEHMQRQPYMQRQSQLFLGLALYVGVGTACAANDGKRSSGRCVLYEDCFSEKMLELERGPGGTGAHNSTAFGGFADFIGGPKSMAGATFSSLLRKIRILDALKHNK